MPGLVTCQPLSVIAPELRHFPVEDCSAATLHDVDGTQALLIRPVFEPYHTIENHTWTTLVGDSEKFYPQSPHPRTLLTRQTDVTDPAALVG